MRLTIDNGEYRNRTDRAKRIDYSENPQREWDRPSKGDTNLVRRCLGRPTVSFRNKTADIDRVQPVGSERKPIGLDFIKAFT